MKIFASLDTIPVPEPTKSMVGRQVANASFLEALWRYGDFDAYHFFAGDHREATRFVTSHKKNWEAHGLKGRVQVFSRLALLDHLSVTDYHVMHQSDFVTSYAELCDIRNRCARVRFPVTAPIHSIYYPAHLQTFLRLLLTGLQPYDAIICTSSAGRAALHEGLEILTSGEPLKSLQLEPRFRMPLIPLGIDLDKFTPAVPDQQRQARLELELPLEVPTLLCLGRFAPADKYDLIPLLRAFTVARRVGDATERRLLERTVLVLAGARQESDYPEQLLKVAQAMGLKDRVRLFVNVEPDQQRKLYQAADIFVSPSDNFQETFGLTVVEAMASGLPVIASDWDGYKDLVEHEVTGYRVPTYVTEWGELLSRLGPISFQRPWHLAAAQGTIVDIPALAGAMRSLILSPGLRAAWGAVGRARAEQFAWPSVIAQYLELWNQLKAEARQDRRPPSAPSMFAPSPLRLFQAHPSGYLNDADRLELSDRGEITLRNPGRREWYPELDPLLDATVIRHLCMTARQNLSIGDSVALVADAQAQSIDRVRYQLAWAIKHDLLRLVKSGS